MLIPGQTCWIGSDVVPLGHVEAPAAIKMPDTQVQDREHVIGEQSFLTVLAEGSSGVMSLVDSLHAKADGIWHKKHFFHLLSHFEGYESLLDDYGARHNQTFSFLRELTASLRGFAFGGYCINHMAGRLESYGVLDSLEMAHYSSLEGHISNVRQFIQGSVVTMLGALREEFDSLGLPHQRASQREAGYEVSTNRQKLPHNIGEADPGDEAARIAEVASKFLAAEKALRGTGLRNMMDEADRHRFLTGQFNEEQARVIEATVHNLQSFYDTHVKHTSLGAKDKRLPQLRGLASVALHMLQGVTALTHFCERHEGDITGVEVERRLNGLVSRSDVQDRVLNHLLMPIVEIMRAGSNLAKQLLADHTNAQELSVTLQDGLMLHARPAALIVRIVTHYGTPVELEVGGTRCNAGSILELLVCVGSSPEQRDFTFHGDENPLRDIAALFSSGLGEAGLEFLPTRLGYLSEG